MNNITVTGNSIICSRRGETVRISACAENAIRFISQEEFDAKKAELLSKI